MAEPSKNIDPHFLQLVLSLQTGAMQQMGKIASPISGKVERNLEMARHSIDLLSMINTKMEGNLTSEEKKILEHILFELRLNYVDETKKDKTDEKKAEPVEKTEKSGQDEKEEKCQADEQGSSKPNSSAGEDM